MTLEFQEFNHEEKREPPAELRNALNYFKQNNDIYKLRKFLKDHGPQEPYELDYHMEGFLNAVLGFTIRTIFRNPDDQHENTFLSTLSTLKDIGILTKELLQKIFDKELTEKEEYSFTDETIIHLKEIIKNQLNWEL